MGESLTVAYQGEPGAYGEEAILGYFGDGRAEPAPLPTFSAVCAAVRDGEADAALLPIENSLAGSVGEAVDALSHADLSVVGELLLPVRHQLLGLPGTALAQVERVASHRQALAQCEPFLAGHGWQLVVTEDTAGAARELADLGDPRRAVIASSRAAARYGLAVIAPDIGGEGNLTRFVVAVDAPDRPMPPPAGPLAPPADAPITSLILFETLHVAGALHHALGSLAEAGINLSRIESRPTGRERWQYRFLIGVDGDAGSEPLRGALHDLRRRAHAVRVLGSFPAAT